MRCPYCGSVVEPARDTSGALFCPACQNTGQVRPAWPPLPDGAVASAGPGTRGPSSTSGKAVAALVLGICSVLTSPLGLLLGPLAIVFGLRARTELKGQPPGSGQGMGLAGLILGVVGIAVSLVTAVVLVAGPFFFPEVAEDEPGGQVTLEFDIDSTGEGGALTLLNLTGTTESSGWYEYELGGTARCTLPNGDIDVGDRIVCVTDGDVVVIDWSDGRTVYSATV